MDGLRKNAKRSLALEEGKWGNGWFRWKMAVNLGEVRDKKNIVCTNLLPGVP